MQGIGMRRAGRRGIDRPRIGRRRIGSRPIAGPGRVARRSSAASGDASTRAREARLFFMLALCGLLLALAPVTVPARSLWTDDRDLTRDYRAYKLGDQLTVLIVESSSGSNQSRTKTEKDTRVGFEGGPGLGALDFIPLFGMDSQYISDHEGKGQTSFANRVMGKITVSVTGLRPNGDMEVMGTRLVTVNNEEQHIRLTGVVRPRDVTADNTVQSTYVGDARIDYGGRGTVTNGTNIGWWKRILDWVF